MATSHPAWLEKPKPVVRAVKATVIALIVLIMLYPFWYVVVASLSTAQGLRQNTGFLLLPAELTFEAYQTVLSPCSSSGRDGMYHPLMTSLRKPLASRRWRWVRVRSDDLMATSPRACNVGGSFSTRLEPGPKGPGLRSLLERAIVGAGFSRPVIQSTNSGRSGRAAMRAASSSASVATRAVPVASILFQSSPGR